MKRFYYCLIILFLCISFDVYAGRGCCSHHGGESGNCSSTGRSICIDGTTSPTCTCSGGSSNSINYVYGCTDKNSINYNPNANRNDGSCIQKIYGCTNPDAFNYNDSANTDNGSCIDKIYGCIDENANNYNSKANTPDGSCLYTKTVIEYKKIKYKTKKKYKLFKKNGTVLQKGKNGKKKIIYEKIVDESNHIINKTIKDTIIISSPTNKIVVSKK